MSRFLFVVPPLLGHVNPARGVAAALAARGHEVAWTGSEMSLRPVLGADALIYRTGTRIHRPQAGLGLASVKSVWERFIVPFTRFTLPAVEKAVSDYQPDVVVTDQITPAGALVAHRRDLPWATLACSTIDLCRPYRALPKVEAWMTHQLATLWAEAGLPASEFFDLRTSPHLMIAFATPELVRPLFEPATGDRTRLVGAALSERTEDPEFDWDWLDPDRKHVLVTMGTLADDISDNFNARAVDALAPLPDRVQAIVLAPPNTLAEPPENVLVLPRVPMLKLMPRLDAVVSHGGLNTVSESLAHGVPLVVAPIRHDQPINAFLVAEAGAGLRVRFARISPAELRAAVTSVLDDPRYRESAARTGNHGDVTGAVAAADHLELLATPHLTGNRSA